jgi:hypothetical protein
VATQSSGNCAASGGRGGRSGGLTRPVPLVAQPSGSDGAVRPAQRLPGRVASSKTELTGAQAALRLMRGLATGFSTTGSAGLR